MITRCWAAIATSAIATASTFAGAPSADTMVARANIQRTQRKIGRVRLCRFIRHSLGDGGTQDRSIHPRTPNVFGVGYGSTPERIRGTLSKLRGRGGEGVEISRNMRQASVRSFRGQSLPQPKLEKNAISPKTWYWPIFRSAKFEPAASQNDPAEIERNWSLKFLQFLEDFSGVYPPGGRRGGKLGRSDWVRLGQNDSRAAEGERVGISLNTGQASVASRHAQSRSVTPNKCRAESAAPKAVPPNPECCSPENIRGSGFNSALQRKPDIRILPHFWGGVGLP